VATTERCGLTVFDEPIDEAGIATSPSGNMIASRSCTSTVPSHAVGSESSSSAARSSSTLMGVASYQLRARKRLATSWAPMPLAT
jgi:hypothetical protein